MPEFKDFTAKEIADAKKYLKDNYCMTLGEELYAKLGIISEEDADRIINKLPKSLIPSDYTKSIAKSFFTIMFASDRLGGTGNLFS